MLSLSLSVSCSNGWIVANLWELCHFLDRSHFRFMVFGVVVCLVLFFIVYKSCDSERDNNK